ncbi:hypothetical protein J3Q64DRAFT_1767164 [Phycomyces blakesleeanus]|uniref:Yeast cell wall synthesis Kre9/Knh1-like N-terminal domain-containing protein n=2 Tax=Phycomyces blakesleeanus TaxID=4837 RepID=A0A162XIE5_PHYB8|nr:hypothetical protein PHYBLDRAFT_181047 [Phycomyces blakesleeanus NRRL 1555(-)]OAD75075.1 hypothetical protein PHYBLDRAFT_181047 [Phycomyces blakesleeanus NRRL 1555(-)]|eukprot:XP_018293115.1 hypothetical protein PHYBLDRAFT_181047 [Phycomyces blakesleeanus NRRL 1555(-)]
MKFAAIVSFLAASAAFVSAVPGISITAPIQNTVWQAGQSHIISWIPTNSTATTITQIEYRHGNSAALTLVSTLTTANIPVSDGQFVWNMPNTTVADGACVLVVTTDKGDPTYSGYFVIQAATPGAPDAFTLTGSPTAAGAAGAVSSGSSNAGSSKAGSAPSASGSGDSAASSSSSSTKSSGASGLKAGVAAVIGAVGAAAMLL